MSSPDKNRPNKDKRRVHTETNKSGKPTTPTHPQPQPQPQPTGAEQGEKYITGGNMTKKGNQTVGESQFIHSLEQAVTGKNTNFDQTQEVGGVKIEKGAKEIKRVITGDNGNTGKYDQKVGGIEIGKVANGIKKFIKRTTGNFELAVTGESNNNGKDIIKIEEGANGIEEVITGKNKNKEALTGTKNNEVKPEEVPRIEPGGGGKGMKVITGDKECTGKKQTIGGIKIGKDVDGVAIKVPSRNNSSKGGKQNIGGHTVV